ncbi:hypothetical protein E2562_022198 [Oryza meyeriana var. granulata]|uniref:Uncharacterized protein n=1 Tax=Oryza meyeriana var. granulata TaxID=110450 RepID=A0A6G1DLX6_9ORYZ|nr:hypothetical protein E2562_022198 [Oryza meyeriana var. granulata]
MGLREGSPWAGSSGVGVGRRGDVEVNLAVGGGDDSTPAASGSQKFEKIASVVCSDVKIKTSQKRTSPVSGLPCSWRWRRGGEADGDTPVVFGCA